MTSLFGIYFGNSTASIAVYKEDGRIDILANDAGDRVTQATLYVTSKEQVVGLPMNPSKSSSTITRAKSLIDSRLSDEEFLRIKQSSLVRIERDATECTFCVSDGDALVTVSPDDVLTHIFKKLYCIGESMGRTGRLECVLAVPHSWDEHTRRRVTGSATEAGWQVLQVVNQPAAALLAYMQPSDTMTALVYRLGGYTCEATVIRVRDGFLSIVGSEKSDVGARAVIDTVAKHLASEFRRKTKLEPEESRKCMSKLWVSSEGLVRTLSTLATASLHLESLYEGVDLSSSLSRARLDSLVSPLLPVLAEPIQRVLAAASLSPGNIDKVVYCGGGLNVAKIKSYVRSLFPVETECCDSLSPQEVIAVGAAKQAGLLSSLSSHPPPELELSSLNIKFLSQPVSLKLSSGEELKLEGALPASQSAVVQLEQDPLAISLTQSSITCSTEIGGFEVLPTSVQVSVSISAADLNKVHIEACDLSNNETKMSSMHLTSVEA